MAQKNLALRKIKRWSDAATSVPRMAYVAMRFGVAPTGQRALATLRNEGATAIHWKLLGDALVEMFQNSGPVLTKFGQILASREDLFPREVLSRLEKLYAKQPAMPKRQLREALKKAYPKGMPFESFEDLPLGVGSIGQVHRARLGGKPVIVKIIRPGIEREIERDMNAAQVLVDLFFTLPVPNRKASHYVIAKALEDLGAGFTREVDLKVEADSLEEFRRRLRKNPRVYVPLCYREHSTGRVLVMEELKGEPLSKFREREGSNSAAAKKLADLALKEILNQIFVEGRFHADPHAGNLLVLEDGRLGLIDLGLTGEFSRKDRKNISRAVRAFVKRDPESMIRALLSFGTPPDDFDYDAFYADVVKTVAKHKVKLGTQLAGKAKSEQGSDALDKFVNDLFGAAFRHRIYVPSSATLLIKTLVTIEGVARSLDPEINLVTAAVPVIMKSLTPDWLRWGFWTA